MNTRRWLVGHCPDSFPNIPLCRNKTMLRCRLLFEPGTDLFVKRCLNCRVGQPPLSGSIPKPNSCCRSTCSIEPDACWSKHCRASGYRHVHNVGSLRYSASAFVGYNRLSDKLPLGCCVHSSISDRANKLLPSILFAGDNPPIPW